MVLDGEATDLCLEVHPEKDVLDGSYASNGHPNDSESAGEGMSDDQAEALLFPANAKPNDKGYQGYTGNTGPTLLYWYHRTVVVLWPASKSLQVAGACGARGALDVVHQHSVRDGAAGAAAGSARDTRSQLLTDLALIVELAEVPTTTEGNTSLLADVPRIRRYSSYFSGCCCGGDTSRSSVWYEFVSPAGHAFVTESSNAARLLLLCADGGAAALPLSRRVLQLLSGEVSAIGTLGMQSDTVAEAVAALLFKAGWEAVGDGVLQLVEELVASLTESLFMVPEVDRSPTPRESRRGGGRDRNLPIEHSRSVDALLISAFMARSSTRMPRGQRNAEARGRAVDALPGRRDGDASEKISRFAEHDSADLGTPVLASARRSSGGRSTAAPGRNEDGRARSSPSTASAGAAADARQFAGNVRGSARSRDHALPIQDDFGRAAYHGYGYEGGSNYPGYFASGERLAGGSGARACGGAWGQAPAQLQPYYAGQQPYPRQQRYPGHQSYDKQQHYHHLERRYADNADFRGSRYH